jgi:glycosyltransferase involved in cell wall biosynthesis
MKILVLTNKLPYPPKDGGSIATLNMMNGLSDTGNQVTCLALNTSKHNFPVEKIPQFISDKIRFIGIDCDSSIKPVALLLNFIFSRKPYIAERFNRPEFRRHLSRLLSDESFDLVQLEGPYVGHYLDTIRSASNAKVSFRAHNVEHMIWKRKASNEHFLLKRWYFVSMASRLKRFETDVINRTDCLVTISPLDLEYFKKRGAIQPAIVMPTGLSLEDYQLTPLPSDSSMFYIGALDWLPNQEGLKWFLENVFDGLCEEIPNMQFHIAGRNAPASFEILMKHDHIIYHGEVGNARDFMQSYRVMVAPLLTGSGIRIKILEAMALGRPVVTTPIGIEGIQAQPDKHVLVSKEPDVFKQQVVRLLSNDSEAKAVIAQGRKLIQENFDTFGLSNRLNRFFNEQV